MNSDLRVPYCEVLSIGEAAFGWLSAGSSGKLLAAVTGAVYLLSEQDELIWITTEASPLHRRCLRVPSPVPQWEVGAPYQVREHNLLTLSGEALDFSHSPVWNPPVLLNRKIVPIGRLTGLVSSVYRWLIAQQEPAGWGGLIPAILQVANHRSPPDEPSRGIILCKNVWPAVEGIVLAGLARDFHLILKHAADLVGLGTGLTPSGDDFLGGLFFSIELLRRAYPETLDRGTWNYSNFILHCQSRTNLISFTLLKDHADGHTLEPFHQFANALLMGQPADHLLPYAEELIAVGHSTGWDLLTGFLAGISMTVF